MLWGKDSQCIPHIIFLRSLHTLARTSCASAKASPTPTMSGTRHPEVAKPQLSNPRESPSDPDPDTEPLSWSEYQRSLKAEETEPNPAATHKTNKELRESDAIAQFFKKIQAVKVLDDATREWIGSLPSTMSERAIPLFTDESTGTDYQLYLSYTWMSGLHTAGSLDAGRVDLYAHSLLHIDENEELELIPNPNIVIPLGKLFVHRSGCSSWTGYEIFVSGGLELWIIDILDEDDPAKVYPGPFERNIFGLTTLDNEQDTQTAKALSFKLARLWPLLSDLKSASFVEAVAEVQRSRCKNYTGSIRLLEIATDLVSQAVLLSKGCTKTLMTRNLKLNPSTSAGRKLLRLANQNADSSILTLLFEADAQPESSSDRELLSLAAQFGDESIARLLLKQPNINAHSKDILDRTPLSHAAAENGHESITGLLLKQPNINADSKDIMDQTPLSYAAENGHTSTIELLLEQEDIEADSRASVGD